MVYIKNNNKYYIDYDHCEFCGENNSPFIDSHSDINK